MIESHISYERNENSVTDINDNDITQTAIRSAKFRKGREEGWIQLDKIVTLVEKKGISALSSEEAQMLPLLYRTMMSSLSVSRNIVLDRNLLLYLENLALRAYLVVYGPRTGMIYNITEFFKHGFPQYVRSFRWHFAVVFIAMLVGCIAGYVLVMNDISYFEVLVPGSLAGDRGITTSTEDLVNNELFAPWQGFTNTFIVFANSLFRHNTLVGIISFGLGFALGIPTIFLMLYNGIIIGAMIALHAKHNLTIDFIGWLSIHGVTELLAILLCGAAGLVIADKIIFPGNLPRLDSLALYGRRAASVVAGAVMLFFIAGFIEGGFRQLINHTAGRFIFAGVTTVIWAYYFIYFGKARDNGYTE